MEPAVAIPNLLYRYAMYFDDGKSAICQSQWTVVHAAPGVPLQIVATGRYRDRMAVNGTGWHFMERDYVQTDLVGDSSAHTLQPLTAGLQQHGTM